MYPHNSRIKGTREAVDPLLVWAHNADPLPEPVTEAAIREYFQVGKTLWKAEKQHADLVQTINSLDLSKVEKIVGFAFSTLRDDLVRSKTIYPHRSTFQHALLITLAETISQGREHRVPCYVQDPIYDACDEKILQAHGITVVNDPNGFLMVDETTLVLSFAPNVCVKQIVTEIAKPIAMIWDTVLDEDLSDEYPMYVHFIRIV
jgi:hypothetical protein